VIAPVAAMLAGATAPTRPTIIATGADGLVAATQMVEPIVLRSSLIVTLMTRLSLRNKVTFLGGEQYVNHLE
jgi:hypothetical protein